MYQRHPTIYVAGKKRYGFVGACVKESGARGSFRLNLPSAPGGKYVDIPPPVR